MIRSAGDMVALPGAPKLNKDQLQQILFMKNLAMAGGFLFLVVHGAGSISLDRRFSQP